MAFFSERFCRTARHCSCWNVRRAASRAHGRNAHINLWTLKFKHPGTEAGFVQSRRQSLMSSSVSAAVCCIVICLFLVAELVAKMAVNEDAFEVEWYKLIFNAFWICLFLFTWIWLRMAGLRISDSAREVAIMLTIVVIITTAVCYDSWYWCKLRGIEPSSTPSCLPSRHLKSDSKVLLVLDGSLTLVHLMLPLRWFILIPLDFVAISLYAMCMVLGSPEEPAGFNFLVLIFLTFFAARGKRTIEQYERSAYIDVLNEKTLRFQKEFQLEQFTESIGRADKDADEATNATTQVFNTTNVDATSDLPSKLEKISMIGRNEQWLVDPADLRIVPDLVLGAGGFGVVVAGYLYEAPVAIKLSKKLDTSIAGKHLVSISNEVRVLRRLRHPNIVLFHGAYVDPHQCDLGLVLERVTGILLNDFISGPNYLGKSTAPASIAVDVPQQRQLCLGICYALNYLHTRTPSIVHGDMKPSNIVVEPSIVGDRPKILDFGLSRILTCGAKPLGHTIAWVAPEVLLHPEQSACASADVFAFGCIVYFIATGRRPRQGQHRNHIIRSARRGDALPLHWPSESPFAEENRCLVQTCIDHCCNQRPIIQSVCKQLLAHASSAGELEGGRGELASSRVLENVRQSCANHALQHHQPVSQHAKRRPQVLSQETRESPIVFQGPVLWLTSIVLDCDIFTGNAAVHRCSYHCSMSASMPDIFFLNPPLCMAALMAQDSFKEFTMRMQVFLNSMTHEEVSQASGVGQVILLTAIRTVEAPQCPISASVTFVGFVSSEDGRQSSTRSDDSGTTLVRFRFENFFFAEAAMSFTRRRASLSRLRPIEEGVHEHCVDSLVVL